MKRFMGIAAASALLFVAGCGGMAELDSSETDTVTSARAAAVAAETDGKLKPGDEKKFEELIVLCREKPLAEDGSESMRQVVESLAAILKSVEPKLSSKMKRIAVSGCD